MHRFTRLTRLIKLLFVPLLIGLTACQSAPSTPTVAPTAAPTAVLVAPTVVPVVAISVPPTTIPATQVARAATTIPEVAYPLLVEYSIPTSASEPGGIVAGPDGAVWFVETASNKIGRITPDGVVTEYTIPTARAIDTDQGFIAVGPDGALWFNEDLLNKIGRITTKGEISEYALPDVLSPASDHTPIRAMVTGSDGALWITSPGANAIVKLTPDGKIAANYPLPKAESVPVGMTLGPDDALWFVEAVSDKIGRVTLDGKLSEYPLPADSKALRITAGPDKAAWFTMFNAGKIGRISMDGKLTSFDVSDMGPVGITAGSDGALWFTGFKSTEIGRMTTDGVLTRMKVPTLGSVPYHIAAGTDGNLWFTEQQGNKIGQIQLSAPKAAQASTAGQPATAVEAKVIAEWKIERPADIVFGFGSVWVTSRRNPNYTTRIDLLTNKEVAIIEGTGMIAKSAVVTGDAVWVGGQRGDLAPIDPKTNTVGIKVPGVHPRIAYGFGSIWAVGHDGEPLDRVDPATSKIIASIPLGGTLSDEENGVVVTASAVWVINGEMSELLKIDPTTNNVVLKTTFDKVVAEAGAQATIPAGKATDFIWLLLAKGLVRVDPNSGAGLSLMPGLGNGGGALAVADNALWLTDFNGHLRRINVATNQVDATYNVGPGIANVIAGNGSLWLAYEDSGIVQRLDITP